LLNRLYSERRITKAVVENLCLGWEASENRLWIPIFNAEGNCVNVRRYDVFKQNGTKYYNYGKAGQGYGDQHAVESPLYPMSALQSAALLVIEGEGDALCAISLGINTITFGSANTDPSIWAPLLKDKEIVLCFHPDRAGNTGLRSCIKYLTMTGMHFKVADLLHFDPSGNSDFTELVVDGRITKESWESYIDSLPLFKETAKHKPTVSDRIEEYLADRNIDILKTTKDGAELWFCCPFHQETEASCSYNTESDAWYCLGCGAGGRGVISFEQKLFGMTYVEAMKKLNLYHKVSMWDAVKSENFNRTVSFVGMLVQQQETPKQLVRKIKITCANKGPCATCSILKRCYQSDGEIDLGLIKHPQQYLNLALSSSSNSDGIIQRLIGKGCKSFSYVPVEKQDAIFVTIQPDLIFGEPNSDSALMVQALISSSHLGQNGQLYEFTGKTVTHPGTQEVMFIIYHAEPLVGKRAELTDTEINLCQAFWVEGENG
jgi:hypothetical protein